MDSENDNFYNKPEIYCDSDIKFLRETLRWSVFL